MPGKPFITVDHITVRLPNRLILEDSVWDIRSDEHWAVLGPNGSGKTTLVRALWGGVPLRSGNIHFDFLGPDSAGEFSAREHIGYVSLEMHQKLMEQEDLKAELRAYAGQTGEGTTAREIIFSGILSHRSAVGADEDRLAEIAGILDMGHLLGRPLAALSTGETRKALIARALMKNPKLLILDEPFEGLDEKSREFLARSIHRLMEGPLRVILVAHRMEEISPNITHVLLVKDGRVFRKGPKEAILTSATLSRLYGCELVLGKENGSYSLSYGREEEGRIDLPREGEGLPGDEGRVLIDMEDTTVKYGDLTVLDHLSWAMRTGENWAILGPNGAGKSTLVGLILGENPQVYANRISLFGKARGSGETIWDIKKRIGVVSAELQVQYRKKMSAYEVIASGFYDSIGLYQRPTEEEKGVVDRWVSLLAMKELAKEPFHQLSFGQKRMILLARAMVKGPGLLIADEPCHGLDMGNRRRVLKVLEKIGETKTALLYITDRREEILPCITHVMRLEKGRIVRQGRKEEVL